MFGTGVWLYAATTRARDRIGHYAFLGYLVLLLMAYVGDRFSGPPASPDEIAWTGLIAEAILLLWAWWFDGHRLVERQSRTRADLGRYHPIWR